MNIFWWIFGLYIAPVIIVGISVLVDGSSFNKHNRWNVFMPIKNLWEALVLIFIFVTVTLISFGDFCEDVWKSFKKHFC